MSDGRITQPWYQMFISLWGRTGAAQGSTTSPTGMIMAFGAATLPTGWQVCDGAAIDRVTFAALYSIIGTTWGIGDGSSTFNVPNLSNRFLIGAGSTAAFASRGGATNFSLSVGNLPAHNHSVNDPGHTHSTLATASNVTTGTDPGGVTSGGTTGSSTTGVTTNNTGTGDPINFLPPYAAVIYGIKT